MWSGSELIPSEAGSNDTWLIAPGTDLRINVARRRTFAHNREISLTKTAFDILALLLSRRGAVVTFEELVSEVWGYDAVGRPGFARTAVYRLRQELKRAGIENPIEAIRGVGFRIASESEADRFDVLAAMRAAKTAICVVSAQGRVLWANPACERLTGYSEDELAALDSVDQLVGDPDPTELERVRAEIRAGHTLRGPALTRRQDGSVVESAASWTPIFDSADALEYVIVELWSDEAAVNAPSPRVSQPG